MLHVQDRAIRIEALELHVTHMCNFSCNFCSHFSNYKHKGNITLEEAENWISVWAKRVSPSHFGILGGEPTLHPNLCEILRITRKHFFNTGIHLVSNGTMLHKHPDLDQTLCDTDILLKISVHADPGQFENFDEKMASIKETLSTWKCRHKFVPISSKWRAYYKGFGRDMQPFEDGDPRASWECCRQKTCHQLHEGKIWKCPQIAYLRMQCEKYNLGPEWTQYLNYQALSPDCTDRELGEFFTKEEEHICNMCPSRIVFANKGNPLYSIKSG